MRRHAVSGPWRIEIKTPSPTSSRHYSAVYAVSTEFVKRFSDFQCAHGKVVDIHTGKAAIQSVAVLLPSVRKSLVKEFMLAQQICNNTAPGADGVVRAFNVEIFPTFAQTSFSKKRSSTRQPGVDCPNVDWPDAGGFVCPIATTPHDAEIMKLAHRTALLFKRAHALCLQG